MENLTEAFRALGDPTRLRILKLISAARLNVTEVVSLVGVAQSSVSHHLTRLRALDLIREERLGGFTYYSLSADEKAPLWPLIELARATTDGHGDQARLTELLRRREDVQTLNREAARARPVVAAVERRARDAVAPARRGRLRLRHRPADHRLARWAKQ